ncbi:MAG TPA: glycosyl hydrolase [Thermoleophilaceae bacterium]
MTFRKLIIGLAAVVLLLAAAPARAAVPKDFFGVVSEDVFTGGPAYRDSTLGLQSAIGVGLIRQTFHWKQIETSRGHYDWSVYDAYMAATASHGIRVLPILFDPPKFRARVSKRTSATYPPRHYSDLGTFGAQVARRYGPNGSFWAANPGLPKLPITAYQIWNEPNLPAYWPSGPNPRQYARLLKATARRIHAVDRRAQIVTAGLPDTHLSRPGNVYSYVKALLHAGADRSFDALGVNPYGKSAHDLVSKIRHFRSILNHGHARSAKLWITEFGWSDRGPASSFRAGSAGQARQIQRVIPAIVKQRSRLRIRGLVYYSWRDGAPYPPAYKDFWGLHTGLLRLNGTPKPAFASFRAAVARFR